MITITEKAAKEVKRIIEEQGGTKLYLRVRVHGGGCSGYTHKLDLDTDKTDKDNVFEINGISVLVDNRSLLYLEGSTVDFIEEINKRGFTVTNPQAVKTCGCGQSFSMG